MYSNVVTLLLALITGGSISWNHQHYCWHQHWISFVSPLGGTRSFDRLGHDPRSLYVEKFWLGVLGPTTILLLRHCAQSLEESPAGFDLNFKATASALGLGRRVGRAGPLTRSFERACRFSVVRSLSPTEIEIRRRLAPLNRKQVSRLSPRRQHEARHVS